MNPVLAAINYEIFPPINAALNSLSTILLITGVILIKSGRKDAHRNVMIGALLSSAVFLACYLTYHYGVGHTEFPREYPLARRIYLAILIPHIILAVVNLPFIILLVVAAFRGNFEKHRRLAKFTFPSWLFVSVTGVIIYFMIYQWFPPVKGDAAPAEASPDAAAKIENVTDAGAVAAPSGPEILEARRKVGDLVFTPVSQAIQAGAGEKLIEVVFSVENTASVPLRILKLESGCECLEVSIDQDPIPARKTAKITGIFDIEKLRGSSERKIAVLTEQQELPVFLTTRIEVEPIYVIEQQMTTWSVGSDPVPKTVAFRVLRDQPVHVLSAESKRPEVTCELVEVEKGRLYHIVLTPSSTEKSLLGIVRLETDCEIESYANPLAYYSIQ
jgi:putative membrane protein